MKLIDKHELKEALGVPSTRIIDSWVRKKMITSYRLGHRTRSFVLAEVIEDLAKFRINAVGRKGK
jgi:hypothetical protein